MVIFTHSAEKLTNSGYTAPNTPTKFRQVALRRATGDPAQGHLADKRG